MSFAERFHAHGQTNAVVRIGTGAVVLTHAAGEMHDLTGIDDEPLRSMPALPPLQKFDPRYAAVTMYGGVAATGEYVEPEIR